MCNPEQARSITVLNGMARVSQGVDRELEQQKIV